MLWLVTDARRAIGGAYTIPAAVIVAYVRGAVLTGQQLWTVMKSGALLSGPVMQGVIAVTAIASCGADTLIVAVHAISSHT